MNVDTERGGIVTLSFISSHKYVIPKVKSFTCIGKYLIFNETYCSSYPTRKCRNIYLKVRFVGITSNKEEAHLVIRACLCS
jgi:hypothetical protein